MPRIFASTYEPYLPTEEKLAAEIMRKRQVIEMRRQLEGIEND